MSCHSHNAPTEACPGGFHPPPQRCCSQSQAAARWTARRFPANQSVHTIWQSPNEHAHQYPGVHAPQFQAWSAGVRDARGRQTLQQVRDDASNQSQLHAHLRSKAERTAAAPASFQLSKNIIVGVQRQLPPRAPVQSAEAACASPPPHWKKSARHSLLTRACSIDPSHVWVCTCETRSGDSIPLGYNRCGSERAGRWRVHTLQRGRG